MDDRTRQGYARLLRDLADLDHHDRFQAMLKRAYGTMEELGKLIERAKELGSENPMEYVQPKKPAQTLRKRKKKD